MGTIIKFIALVVMAALIVYVAALVAVKAVIKLLSNAGEFSKISYKQFRKDMMATFTMQQMETLGILSKTEDEETTEDLEYDLKQIYMNIRIPKRGTSGSAGYDFFAPFAFALKPGETIKFPTGIRCKMAPWWFLLCLPRSGLGFKYRCQLDNTAGVIDRDYFYADNEGHIFVKLTNDSKEEKAFVVKIGQGYMQGIFVLFGLAAGDQAKEKRTGGFGSTTKGE